MSDQTLQNIRSLTPETQARAIAFINGLRSYGAPAIVVSGRRSIARNIAVGGATDSRHLTGTAFDVGFLGFQSSSLPASLWNAVGEYGEGFGLRWGGRFSVPDPVHFDLG